VGAVVLHVLELVQLFVQQTLEVRDLALDALDEVGVARGILSGVRRGGDEGGQGGGAAQGVGKERKVETHGGGVMKRMWW